MSKALTNPLQSLVGHAARTLPAETGKVSQQQMRLDRRRGETVILADVSGSMAGAAWGRQRKIDVLRQAVDAARANTRLIAFSGVAREVQHIPEPESNTNLAAALREAQKHDPGTTLLISDGHPDNARAALDIARTFRGVIDVLYIGPEDDASAIAFMRQLAAAAGGSVTVNDIGNRGSVQQLTQHIERLLPGPRA